MREIMTKEKLIEILKKFSEQKFYVYGYDIDEEHGNCILKKRSTEGFLDNLANSRGVIASAGFSLISECLYFRKKMLLIPVAGQYEQIINSHYVEKLGMGIQANEFTEEALKKFLTELDKPMPKDDKILWPDNEKFFEMLQIRLSRLETPVNLNIF